MAEYEFQIFCRGVDISDDSFLDRLYEAGCDDALVSFKDGYVCLNFSRSSESAEEAVLSAIRDFAHSAVGGSVERVEPDDLASHCRNTREESAKLAKTFRSLLPIFPVREENFTAQRK